MTELSALLLQKQLRDLTKNPVDGFSAGLQEDDLYTWSITIFGPPNTPYEGGFFKSSLVFPKEYPQLPPVMKFQSEMWHPSTDVSNLDVHIDGVVCISILHAPGEDKYGYEEARERWLPVHTVESIVISVISMLGDPNDESPANVEAAKQWRDDLKSFNRKVRGLARKTVDL